MSRVITGKEHCAAASSIKAVRCRSVAQDQCPASESTENVPRVLALLRRSAA